MSLKNKLNTYTKLSPLKRSQSLKWIAKQNEELILYAFEKQKNYLFKLSKYEEANKSILYQSAFCLAADELYNLHHAKKGKNKVMNLNEIGDRTTMQIKHFKREQPTVKYDRLLNLKGKILTLIDEEGFSYREVSKFLKKYHRFEVSHTLIGKFYNDMKDTK